MIFPHRSSGLKKTHESWHETTIIITMHEVGNSPLENLQIPTIHQQTEEREMGDEQRLQFSTQFVIDSDAKPHTSACVAPDCPNWSILPDLFRGYNSSCYGRIHRTTLQSFSCIRNILFLLYSAIFRYLQINACLFFCPKQRLTPSAFGSDTTRNLARRVCAPNSSQCCLTASAETSCPFLGSAKPNAV